MEVGGYIEDDPQLAKLQGEEAEAYLRDMVRGIALGEAPVPDAPVLSPNGHETAAEASDDDVFDASDLYEVLESRSELIRMPNGKKAWVHPCSAEEGKWLNRQALKEVRRVYPRWATLADKMEAENRLSAAEAAEVRGLVAEVKAEALFRAQVYQVIACLRKGPEPDSPKVFDVKKAADHAKALRCNPGWLDAIQQIVALSDSLSTCKSETALLTELLRGFFGRMESWLAMLCSRLNVEWSTDCPEPSEVARVRMALEDFAYSVSATNQPGTPLTSRVQGLCMVMEVSEGE